MYGAWTKRVCGTVLAFLLCMVPAFASGADVVDTAGKSIDAPDNTITAAENQPDKTDKTDETRYLIPVGHTVGMKLFSKGVMVVKLVGGDTPAKACGLRIGDVITSCDGAPVTSAEQFQALLSDDGDADLKIRRDGGEIVLNVTPERDDAGTCSIGAWVRDSMAGIGTLTWYDPENDTFGALGHGVTDVDTGLLMPFQDGAILPSRVKAIKKGEKGAAGELRGDFDLSTDLGRLYANTNRGVFGVFYDDLISDNANSANNAILKHEPMAIGEPVKGPARILTNISGNEIQEYDIEILKVEPNEINGRELVIAVTDPDLLDQTGGIVQGMSGSPILQDNQFVGAVTHVLLQDPAKGYGISLNSMLKAA